MCELKRGWSSQRGIKENDEGDEKRSKVQLHGSGPPEPEEIDVRDGKERRSETVKVNQDRNLWWVHDD